MVQISSRASILESAVRLLFVFPIQALRRREKAGSTAAQRNPFPLVVNLPTPLIVNSPKKAGLVGEMLLGAEARSAAAAFGLGCGRSPNTALSLRKLRHPKCRH